MGIDGVSGRRTPVPPMVNTHDYTHRPFVLCVHRNQSIVPRPLDRLPAINPIRRSGTGFWLSLE